MKKTSLVWVIAALVCFSACSQQDKGESDQSLEEFTIENMEMAGRTVLIHDSYVEAISLDDLAALEEEVQKYCREKHIDAVSIEPIETGDVYEEYLEYDLGEILAFAVKAEEEEEFVVVFVRGQQNSAWTIEQ